MRYLIILSLVLRHPVLADRVRDVTNVTHYYMPLRRTEAEAGVDLSLKNGRK